MCKRERQHRWFTDSAENLSLSISFKPNGKTILFGRYHSETSKVFRVWRQGEVVTIPKSNIFFVTAVPSAKG